MKLLMETFKELYAEYESTNMLSSDRQLLWGQLIGIKTSVYFLVGSDSDDYIEICNMMKQSYRALEESN